MSDPRVATVRRTDGGRVQLGSPAVGWWIRGPEVGQILIPGAPLGRIDVLGRGWPLTTPADVGGRVVRRFAPGRDRVAVEHGTVLVELDGRVGSPGLDAPTGVTGATGATGATATPRAETALVFRAPMSGRLYRRQSPDQPLFVKEGDLIEAGQTVCLLEVMKTFNRVVYGGPNLPPRARVVRVLVDDGADVAGQEPVLELEAP